MNQAFLKKQSLEMTKHITLLWNARKIFWAFGVALQGVACYLFGGLSFPRAAIHN